MQCICYDKIQFKTIWLIWFKVWPVKFHKKFSNLDILSAFLSCIHSRPWMCSMWWSSQTTRAPRPRRTTTEPATLLRSARHWAEQQVGLARPPSASAASSPSHVDRWAARTTRTSSRPPTPWAPTPTHAPTRSVLLGRFPSWSWNLPVLFSQHRQAGQS